MANLQQYVNICTRYHAEYLLLFSFGLTINTLQKYEVSKKTYQDTPKNKEITNVILVENCSLHQEI